VRAIQNKDIEMEKRDLAFKRLFPSIVLDDKPIRNMEWPELQARKKDATANMKRYLDKLDKSDDYEMNEAEQEACRMLEDMLAAVDREMNERLESGNKGPRPVRIGGGNGKTRNAARTGGELRSGEVGLRPEELFGPGDMGPYQSRDDFYAHVLANQAPEARNMVEGIGAQGGFTVPTQLHRDILNSVYEESVTLPFVRQFRMDTLTLSIPMWDSEDRSQGGIASFEGQWIAEATDADIKTPKLRLVTLTAHKLMVLTRISRECISDSFSLGQQLQPTLVKSLAYTLDSAVIGGTGVGRPLGILGSPSRIQVARSVANQISYTDICNLFVRLHPGFLKGARWLVSPSAVAQLLALADAGSNNLWVPAAGPAIPPTLLGLPVGISEKCSALGSEGDIILCNLGQYAFGLREDFIVERSDSAYFASDQVAFRCIVRCDGHALMDAPISPVSGSTLSWAVTLV